MGIDLNLFLMHAEVHREAVPTRGRGSGDGDSSE